MPHTWHSHRQGLLAFPGYGSSGVSLSVRARRFASASVMVWLFACAREPHSTHPGCLRFPSTESVVCVSAPHRLHWTRQRELTCPGYGSSGVREYSRRRSLASCSVRRFPTEQQASQPGRERFSTLWRDSVTRFPHIRHVSRHGLRTLPGYGPAGSSLCLRSRARACASVIAATIVPPARKRNLQGRHPSSAFGIRGFFAARNPRTPSRLFPPRYVCG